jgi:hypothetical protein
MIAAVRLNGLEKVCRLAQACEHIAAPNNVDIFYGRNVVCEHTPATPLDNLGLFWE